MREWVAIQQLFSLRRTVSITLMSQSDSGFFGRVWETRPYKERLKEIHTNVCMSVRERGICKKWMPCEVKWSVLVSQ